MNVIGESVSCASETTIIWYINYTSIKKLLLKKFNTSIEPGECRFSGPNPNNDSETIGVGLSSQCFNKPSR